MKLTRIDRSLIAWTLYCCVLFSAFACSIGHGQVAGLQLSGIDGGYCSAAGNSGSAVDLTGSGSPALNPFACALCSTFMGLALATFFGLLGLLGASRQPRAAPLPVARPVRYLWPSANPRASPLLA